MSLLGALAIFLVVWLFTGWLAKNRQVRDDEEI